MVGVTAVVYRLFAEVPEVDKLPVTRSILGWFKLCNPGIGLTDERLRSHLSVLDKKIKAGGYCGLTTTVVAV
jgi:hypothetical protein